MIWANFLHIYQPPTQKEIWVRRIANESYRKLFTGFLEIPRAHLTLNINGVLCELLERYGGKDVLNQIRTLAERGQIELTGSAKYHAFLPLLPESEIERQIKLNEETLAKFFGPAFTKRGFFSPEMAFSPKVAAVAKRLGYQWIIADELGLPKGEKLSDRVRYQIQNLEPFEIYFRERSLSFTVLSANVGTTTSLFRYLGDQIKKPGYVVTAMDGETFGHHRPGLEVFLFDLLRNEKITPVQISELKNLFLNLRLVLPRESTWATTRKDLQRDEPFSRWQNKENLIQKFQWELTNLAVSVVGRNKANPAIRGLLDQALHSDQYWWASARPWWSLEMIERGAYELKSVILESVAASPTERERAEKLYQNIIYTGFAWQREGKVDQISRQEDEEIEQRLEEKEKPFITKTEYEQMLTTLAEQMKLAAKSGEYHRAAMIQDRIRELGEEMGKARE